MNIIQTAKKSFNALKFAFTHRDVLFEIASASDAPEEFEDTEDAHEFCEPKTSTEFDQLTCMLTAAGADFRTWPITSLDEQPFQGDVVVIGSEGNDQPFSQFVFDFGGVLVRAEAFVG